MTLLQHHLLALGLTSISTLALGLFVFWKNPKRHLYQTMALYSFSLAWWSGWECAALQMPTKELIVRFFRIEYIGVAFIPTMLCAVVSFLLNFSPAARRRFLAPLCLFSFATLFAATSCPTKYFLGVSRTPMLYLPTCPVAGSYYWVFLAFFFGASIIGHALIFQRWRRAAGQERARLGLFLAGSVVAYLGGCPEFVLKYGLRLGWLNPFGLYGIPVYMALVTYAIVRHQFLDIRIVIRKSLVYSLLVACITATYLVMVLVMERWFQGFLGYRSLFGTLVAAFLIAVFFNPLRNRIQAWVDHALFNATPAELAVQREQLLVEVRKGDQMKAVATLAAGMAHEIKNPLTSLKTFTDYLPSKGSDPAFRRKFQRVVTQEVGKIDRIVHQLLDFSKPTPPQLQLIRVSEVLDETLDFLNSECLKRRVIIKRTYDAEDLVSGDPQQLRQVFLNLFLNSLEAMDGHGGTLSVAATQQNGQLTVTIQDTGPGIPAAHLGQVFEPFFTTKPSGTGLGLSVVRNIVEEHGGRISLENVNGHGARCVLTLPLVTIPRNLVLP